jgi:hypothetical protein
LAGQDWFCLREHVRIWILGLLLITSEIVGFGPLWANGKIMTHIGPREFVVSNLISLDIRYLWTKTQTVEKHIMDKHGHNSNTEKTA